jgi:nucleoside triphosphatase
MTERPRVTVGALVFNNRELLLLKSPKWHGKYIVPCGHIELMEKVEDAVRREILEETGLSVKDIKFLKYLEFINSPEFHKPDMHFVALEFCCESSDRNVKLNEEATEHLWISPEKALDLNLESGTREALEFYLKNII